MHLSVTDTSQYIFDFLNQPRQGKVHSVYRKTINLSFDGQLLALQAAGSPLSPISLILPLTGEEIAALSVEVGAPVTATSGFLQLGEEHQLLFQHTSLWNLKLNTTLSQEQLPLLEERLLTLLSCHNAGSFELLLSAPDRAKQIPFLSVAKRHLDSTAQELSASCWDKAAEKICRLIGLGLGLTPGGDDFLCGVLAALILSDHFNHPFAYALRAQITTHLADTNEISAAFLCCALEGQFSQAVNSLLLLPPKEQILASFSAIGHSSGTDTLCGIYYLLKNRAFLQA